MKNRLIAVVYLTASFFLLSDSFLFSQESNFDAQVKSQIGDQEIEMQVDQFVANLPDEFYGTILLAIGDRVLMNKGYGFADRSFAIRNAEDTKYQLASISKDFTTILVFKLIEMGLIDLDATIDKYLPEYPRSKASKITIHHLILHQSGIKHHFQAIPNFLGTVDQLYHTPREFLELFWNVDLAHEPGKGTTYTSPGYSVLVDIMERVTGRSFSELLREHIFLPLGLENTVVDNNLTTFKNLARGYKKGINGYVFDLEEVPSNLAGAGDMISTTMDLYRFQKILSTDNTLVLSKSSKEKLFEVQFKINDSLVRANIATLAKHVYNDGKDTITQYGIGTGGNYGFQSRLTRFLEIDACYIVLSNVHNGRAMNEQMYCFLQDILFKRAGIQLKTYYPLGSSAPSSIPIEVNNEQLKKYEGLYKTDDSGFIQVFLKDGSLRYRDYMSSYWNWINVYGGELLPISKWTFVDNNQFTQRYFIFVMPKQLTKDSPGASFMSLFNDVPDTSSYHLVQIRWGAPSRALRWTSDGRRSNIEIKEYGGLYYSEELQRTYKFSVERDRLAVSDFVGSKNMICTFLAPNLFVSEKGFLVFHRYNDGSIRDFWLMSENLDHDYGSLFIKK